MRQLSLTRSPLLPMPPKFLRVPFAHSNTTAAPKTKPPLETFVKTNIFNFWPNINTLTKS